MSSGASDRISDWFTEDFRLREPGKSALCLGHEGARRMMEAGCQNRVREECRCPQKPKSSICATGARPESLEPFRCANLTFHSATPSVCRQGCDGCFGKWLEKLHGFDADPSFPSQPNTVSRLRASPSTALIRRPQGGLA